MNRYFASAAFLAISFSLALPLVGCQRLREHKWRGQGYDRDANSLTENLRPPADEQAMTGYDERARDIERNLGVR
jgi:hypothetical protein